MRRPILLFLLLFLSLGVFGQAPNSFKYQAVIRNADGTTKQDEEITVEISLLQGTSTGTSVYTETHTDTTNAFGLVNLNIGNGSTSDDFSAIDWSDGPFFLKISVDAIELGTSQLLSVPFAMYAEKSGDSFSGSYNDLTDVPGHMDTDSTDDFDGDYNNLSNTPDLSVYSTTDTTLVESEVDEMVADNGYAMQEALIDTAASIRGNLSDVALSGDYADLSNTPDIIDSVQSVLDTTTLFLKASDMSDYTGAVYRWTVFSTYNQGGGWFGSNNSALFGGIAPSNWSDGGAIASSMSSDKQILLTLLNKKGYAGKNALIWAEEWYHFSSTNGKHAIVLFRIENTTGSAIIWPVSWYSTAYGGWGERASVAINGVNVWNSSSMSYYGTHKESTSISIPANRVSTVIFVAGSSPVSTTRGLYLAFDNDCLDLPAGLEYVDDLDTAPNGWDY